MPAINDGLDGRSMSAPIELNTLWTVSMWVLCTYCDVHYVHQPLTCPSTSCLLLFVIPSQPRLLLTNSSLLDVTNYTSCLPLLPLAEVTFSNAAKVLPAVMMITLAVAASMMLSKMI